MINEFEKYNIIINGNFTLKSGKKSKKYIDLKKIISYPHLHLKVCNEIIEKININIDLICGTPYGAVPFVSYISISQKIPMLFLRKETKTYGTKKLIDGVFSRGQKVVLVEDVVSTGKSIFESASKLEEEGLVISQIICVVSRTNEKLSYKTIPIEFLYKI